LLPFFFSSPRRFATWASAASLAWAARSPAFSAA
jgi:hypothetical protein